MNKFLKSTYYYYDIFMHARALKQGESDTYDYLVIAINNYKFKI